jgi:cytoplasmic iron level regulating protein YaaA (DUF328/UPF0246 family)
MAMVPHHAPCHTMPPYATSTMHHARPYARLNHGRYRAWGDAGTVQKPCALAFNGPAYQHLRAAEFSPEVRCSPLWPAQQLRHF